MSTGQKIQLQEATVYEESSGSSQGGDARLINVRRKNHRKSATETFHENIGTAVVRLEQEASYSTRRYGDIASRVNPIRKEEDRRGVQQEFVRHLRKGG